MAIVVLVLLQPTLPIKNIYHYYNYYYLLLIMPIQKNDSGRMGGPKKGQCVTILLIKASTAAGVCKNHNLLPAK